MDAKTEQALAELWGELYDAPPLNCGDLHAYLMRLVEILGHVEEG